MESLFSMVACLGALKIGYHLVNFVNSYFMEHPQAATSVQYGEIFM